MYVLGNTFMGFAVVPEFPRSGQGFVRQTSNERCMNALVRFAKIAFAIALLVGSSLLPLSAAPTVAVSRDTWPMSITAGGGTIVLSEPQVRSWPNYTSMTGVAAIAITLPGASAPVYGVLRFSSLASADVPAGMVSLVNPKLVATAWPTASVAETPALDAFLKTNLHLAGKPLLPLAMVLSSIPRSERPRTVPVRTNPPVIYVSQRPAVLIGFDGKPVFAPITGTALTYAVNTNWEIVHDPGSALYYVHAKSGWYASPGSAGPFTPAVAPASFSAIPSTGPLSHVHAALSAPKPGGTTVPHIFVSTVPSALIVIAGQPQFASIAGTQLRYVTNTRSDLFFSRDTTLWYVLLAGRWFSAANLNGPWTFASTRLPADFKKIPEDSPRGRVLISVPGTTQAFYAANAAQAPLVTTVDRKTATLTVTYATGEPVFAPIAGTPLQYAVNTTTDLIKVGAASYFACDHGAWFTATAAMGPWKAAAYVPAVIYTIPESSPLYRVTFVHIYDARGVAMTAPQATPVPQPEVAYQNFGAGELSAGDRASYYNTATSGYYAGFGAGWGGYVSGTGYYVPGYYGDEFWVPSLPTYGNYNDTYYARMHAANPRSAMLERRLPPPGHGPRSIPGLGTNVYAADDGVYRYVRGNWEKNGADDTWSAAPDAPATLRSDRRARLAGYAGTIR
jgi:hypothetical protein